MEFNFSEANTRTDLMKAVLTHYTEKLRTIMVDPELGQHRTECLKEDLVNEMMFAEKVRIRLHDEGFNFDSKIVSSKPGLDVESERNVIISALQSYHSSLEESKNTLVRKLGTTPNLEKLDMDITLCNKFLDDINESYPKKK